MPIVVSHQPPLTGIAEMAYATGAGQRAYRQEE